MNRFGQRLVVSLEGSSHGPFVGVTVDGLPSGLALPADRVQAALDRRRPVGRRLATKRQEPDLLVVDAGLRDGRTTGDPLRAHVDNLDADRAPYEAMRDTPRPGHADYPARARFGPGADLSGGGIFSGRMTIALVIAGAAATALLAPRGIEVVAYTRAIAGIDAPAPGDLPLGEWAKVREANEVGALDRSKADQMEAAIAAARRSGDSVGGLIEAHAVGLPVGLGEPFFDSIESVTSHLAFSIPGVKGVEFGAGFASAGMTGSQHNDPFDWRDGVVVPRTNHAGGILGGLSTGAPVVLRVAVKPTPSIARPQPTVDLRTGAAATLVVKGRHDPCIVPRAVVVVESVLALALADLALVGGFVP